MIFLEQKNKQGYQYQLTDIFGSVEIESINKLDASKLDGIVCILLRQNISAPVVQGEVKSEGDIIKYRFIKAPQWSDDDDEKICENLPTLMCEAGKEFTPIRQYITHFMSWPRKFVGAFREAWKKAK